MRYLLIVLIVFGGCTRTDVDDTPFDESTCEVIRHDGATGVVVDQFVYSDLGLLSHTWQIAPGTRGLRVNTYKDDVLISAESEAWHQAAEIQTYGAWQSRTAIYQSDTYFHHELKFAYDAAGRLTQWETRATTSYDDKKDVSLRRVVYTRNAQGQKVRTDEYSGSPDPWLSRIYTYDELGRTKNIQTVQDGHEYGLSFVYDERGNLIRRVDDSGGGSRLDYDAQGHLIGASGQVYYTRDNDGRILAVINGTAAKFTYDDGRLINARYNGSSYTQTYSPGCPAGFTHPLITPNSLYLEHYEGPPLHHTWSNY